tara:strand:+ start:3841 stop:4221 length:381 start_codon:yes stop_codon:yes gene_type:complete
MGATVLGALGLAFVWLVPAYASSLCAARHQTATTTITFLADATKAFKIQNRRWPESLDELVECEDCGRLFTDHATIPMDPWGNSYFYEAPKSGSTPTIVSFGEDGEPGGEGSDRDVTYEQILDGES